MITLSSSMIPCHAEEHECGTTSEHHHDTSDDDSEDEHPCSPFCMHHSSFFTEKSAASFSVSIVISDLKEMYLFNYYSVLSDPHNNSLWRPPQM